MRIVALALDAYGDQVLRQPMLSALLDAGHSVTLVMQPRYADIVPHVDPRLSTLPCDVSLSCRLSDDGVLTALRDCVDRIRALAPELVVALRYDRSAVDEWLLRSCAFAERMAYFPANRSDSLVDDGGLAEEELPGLPFDSAVTRALAVQAGIVETSRNELLFHNITGASTPLPAPRLLCSADDRSQAEAWVAATPLAGRRYVVVAPAGTSNHSMKQMPEALAVAAIEALWLEHGLATVLAGVESERPHLDQVLARVPSAYDHVVQWIGRTGTLGPLLGLLANAEAYVGADLGTMHFAGALGRPVVALFGGGHYPRFQPAAPRWAAVTKRLPCFGCEWHCLFDRVRCVDEVSVDTWLDAIRSVIEGQSPKWILDPSGLSESSARAAEPEVAKIRAILDRVESDRFERLLLLETQEVKLREVQADLAEVEIDARRRIDKLLSADRDLAAGRAAMAALNERLVTREAQQSTLAEERDQLQARVAEIPSIQRDLADRITTIARQEAELAGLAARVAELAQDQAKHRELIDRQHAELDDLRQRLGRGHEDALRAAERIASLERSHSDLSATRDRTLAELTGQRAEAHSLLESLGAAREALDASSNEASSLRSQLDQAAARVTELETVRGALRAVRSALRRKSRRRLASREP